jgi:hypothetical protein
LPPAAGQQFGDAAENLKRRVEKPRQDLRVHDGAEHGVIGGGQGHHRRQAAGGHEKVPQWPWPRKSGSVSSTWGSTPAGASAPISAKIVIQRRVPVLPASCW